MDNPISKIVKEKNLTAYTLAQKTGLATSGLQRIINAPAIPDHTTWRTLRLLGRALNCTLDELTGFRANGANHANTEMPD